MKRLLVSGLVLLCLGMSFSRPALAGEAERLLPGNTILYVSVEDVSALAEKIARHPMRKFLEEEEVVAFLSPILEEGEKGLGEMRKEFAGATPFDLLDLVEGQVALAFTGVRTGSRGMRPGVVFLARVGENEEAVRVWIAKMEEGLHVEEEFRRVEESFRGTPFVSYVPNEDLEKEMEEVEVLPCWALEDGLFLLTTDDELLRMMLLRRTEEEGESTGLGAEDEFRLVRDRTGADSDVFVYANLAAVWNLLPRLTGSDKAAGEGMRVIDAMGLKELRSIGAALRFESDGFSQRAFLHVPGPRAGLLRLMPRTNSALLPPGFVPPDALQATTMKLDIGGFWAGLRGILDAVDAGSAEEFDSDLSVLKEEAGIDLEKDLVGLLEGTVTMYGLPPKPIEASDIDIPEGMVMPRAVYAFRATDPEKLGRTLDAFVEYGRREGGVPFEEEEYLGVRMHVLPLTESMAYAAAVVGDQLVVSLSREDLQSVIRRQGKEDVPALVGGEAFARAMRSVPPIRSMVYFSDLGAQLGSVGEQLGAIFSYGGPDLPLDFSAFPADAIKAYFGVLGGALVSEDVGFSLVSRSRMNVPEEK